MLPFEISIHDPMSVADIYGKGIKVEPGTVTTFTITPSQIITSPNAKSLSVDKRQCLFRDEMKSGSIFNDYTQVNCQFECLLKSSYEKCHCVPWDFPKLNETWKICDLFGRECFKTLMKNTTESSKCNCPLDCATTRYAYSIDTTPLNPALICSNKNVEKFLASGITGDPPKFIRHYEKILYGKDTKPELICIQRISNMAVAKFQIVDKIITRIKKTRRMTFADFLSNIGRFIISDLDSQSTTSSIFRRNSWIILWN